MASQDMPPPGGYATINVQRTFPRPMLRHGIWFGISIGLTLNGLHYAREWKKRHSILRAELAEHFIAASPFLYAEQERKFLRHLKVVRERERELMKDHPNWKLGTLYGEPVYKTIPEGELPPIDGNYFATFNTEDEWFFNHQMPDINR